MESPGSSIEHLSLQVLELKGAFQVFQGRLENLSHESCITQQILTQLLEELKHSREDAQKYYQALASKLNEPPNVIVVDGNVGTSQAIQSSGQVITIPNLTTPYEQTKESYNDSGLGGRSIKHNTGCNEVTTHESTPTHVGPGRSIVELVRAATCVEQQKMVADVHNGSPKAHEETLAYPQDHDTTGDKCNSSSIIPLGASANQNYNQRLHALNNSKEFQQNTNGTLVVAGKHHNRSVTGCKPAATKLPTEKLICPYCPRKFEHNHSVSLHIRSCKKKHENKKNAVKSNETPIGCNTTPTTSNQICLNTDKSKPASVKLGKMIKCSYCERKFPTKHQVTSHERVHTGDRPYSCYVCEVKFAHGGNMIKHIKNKHRKYNPYVCRHCNTNFKTHLDVQNHRKKCASTKERAKPNGQAKAGRFASFSAASKVTKGDDSEATETASEDEGNSRDLSFDGQQKSIGNEPAFHSNVGQALAIKFEYNETVSNAPTNSFIEQNKFLGLLHKEGYNSSTNVHNASSDTLTNGYAFTEVKMEICQTSHTGGNSITQNQQTNKDNLTMPD